ncbi:hypothetical protein GCM10020254_80640 [Streptomyces goshikiensis]
MGGGGLGRQYAQDQRCLEVREQRGRGQPRHPHRQVVLASQMIGCQQGERSQRLVQVPGGGRGEVPGRGRPQVGQEAGPEEDQGPVDAVDVAPAVHHARPDPHHAPRSQVVRLEVRHVAAPAGGDQGEHMEIRPLRPGTGTRAVHLAEPREAEDLHPVRRTEGGQVVQLPHRAVSAFHKRCVSFHRGTRAGRQ